MTKTVRIENADNGTAFKLVAETWTKSATPGEPDKLLSTTNLDYPTAMASGNYVVVKEPTPLPPGDGGPDPVTPHK